MWSTSSNWKFSKHTMQAFVQTRIMNVASNMRDFFYNFNNWNWSLTHTTWQTKRFKKNQNIIIKI